MVPGFFCFLFVEMSTTIGTSWSIDGCWGRILKDVDGPSCHWGLKKIKPVNGLHHLYRGSLLLMVPMPPDPYRERTARRAWTLRHLDSRGFPAVLVPLWVWVFLPGLLTWCWLHRLLDLWALLRCITHYHYFIELRAVFCLTNINGISVANSLF